LTLESLTSSHSKTDKLHGLNASHTQENNKRDLCCKLFLCTNTKPFARIDNFIETLSFSFSFQSGRMVISYKEEKNLQGVGSQLPNNKTHNVNALGLKTNNQTNIANGSKK
jgi:hypothetical protein